MIKILNMKQFNFLLLLFWLATNLNGYAQVPNKFQSQIDAFKKQDSLQAPIKNPILFVGSSSFRKWTNINTDLSGYPILNRAFGGSSLPDLITFANETIIQYHPKQIYIYCGDNDLGHSDSVTTTMVLERFKTLYANIRKGLGKKVPIVYVSIKPSIARWKLENKIIETNALIQSFLSKEKNTQFLDIHSAMLNENKEVLKDIFIADNLHMNQKGYAIWTKIITPTLLK